CPKIFLTRGGSAMRQLLQAILQIPEAAEAAQALREGRQPVAVTGLASIHRSLLAAALAMDTGRTPVLLCADEGEARRIYGDLEALTGETPLMLCARELYRPAGSISSREFDHRRIAALCRLAAGETPPIVATAEALLQRTAPPEALKNA